MPMGATLGGVTPMRSGPGICSLQMLPRDACEPRLGGPLVHASLLRCRWSAVRVWGGRVVAGIAVLLGACGQDSQGTGDSSESSTGRGEPSTGESSTGDSSANASESEGGSDAMTPSEAVGTESTGEGSASSSEGSGAQTGTATSSSTSDSGDDSSGSSEASGSESGSDPTPASPRSDLPAPPTTGVPRPAGALGGFRVLDWAGFGAAVSYTFDDSLTSQIEHYPALQASGVRMTFYVVSGNNGSNEVWREAALDGHELGNHTAHHCRGNGTGCTWGTFSGSLDAEIRACTEHLQSEFGVPGVHTMAAPFGNTEWGEAAKTSLFINRGAAEGQVAPRDATDPFNLPSHITATGESAESLNQLVDSARNAGTWQLMLIHSLGGDGGASPIMIDALLDNIEHAQNPGDVWIDTVENVGAYWRAQTVVSAVAPTTSGSATTWVWTLPEHFPPGKFLRVTVDGGTLLQDGIELEWDEHGYYEVALDAGTVALVPEA